MRFRLSLAPGSSQSFSPSPSIGSLSFNILFVRPLSLSIVLYSSNSQDALLINIHLPFSQPSASVASLVRGRPYGGLVWNWSRRRRQPCSHQCACFSLSLLARCYLTSLWICCIKSSLSSTTADAKVKVSKENVEGRDLLSLLVRANMAHDLPAGQQLSDEDVLARLPLTLYQILPAY